MYLSLEVFGSFILNHSNDSVPACEWKVYFLFFYITLFALSSKWITSCQNAWNSLENLRNVFFFGRVKLDLSRGVSFCIVLVVLVIFSVVIDDWMTASIDP